MGVHHRTPGHCELTYTPMRVRSEGVAVRVVTPSGAFHAAYTAGKDASGRDLRITVPYNTPLKLWVFSRQVRLSDENGTAIGKSGAGIAFQIPNGVSSRTFTLNVIGPASP